MDKLPCNVYVQICEHLDDLRDVMALENSCRRIRTQVKALFWGQPRKLRLTDSAKAQIFMDNGRMYRVPTTLGVLTKICVRARNMTEFDLASYTVFPDDFLKKFVKMLRHQRKMVTSLYLSYQNPEAMYSPTNSFSEQEEDHVSYPSREVHKYICKLVGEQSRNLRQLFVQINQDGFIVIDRDLNTNEISVEFACQYSQELRTVLFPFFSGFNKKMNDVKPRVLRLGIRGEGECVLPAFDFCTHAAIPFECRGCLEEIHYRISNAETVAILNYDAFVPQIVASLHKVSLYIDDVTLDANELRDIGSKLKPNNFNVELSTRNASFQLPGLRTQALAC